MPRDVYKHAYPAPRQVGGDDGFSWVVYVHGRPRLMGLTRTEAEYYRRGFEEEERKRAGEPPLRKEGKK